MRKAIYFLSLICALIQPVFAQNNPQADKVLSDLLSSAKTNAIKTNFKLTTTDKSTAQGEIATGTFTLKGNKFVLDMGPMKVWFDGKTQWAFSEQSNEVSITEPTEKELAETNPMAILSGFKSKCLIKFSQKIKSAQNYCIEMTPKTKNSNISKIEVQVNKTTGNLFSIKTTNTNESTTLLLLNNFQKGLKVTDDSFAFNQSKHKGISVNDLR